MATKMVTMTQVVDNVSADVRGIVAVRYVNTYTDADGTVLQEAVAGDYINPGDDYSDKDLRVQAVCKAVQTEAVIDAFKAAQLSQAPVQP